MGNSSAGVRLSGAFKLENKHEVQVGEGRGVGEAAERPRKTWRPSVNAKACEISFLRTVPLNHLSRTNLRA